VATTGSMDAAGIAAAAKAGGFPDSEIPLAVAIALAESGGNPRAHNATPPDNSYGLWQINMYGPLGPARRAQYGLQSNEELFDPVKNARAAYAVRRGQGWTAWSVYTNGRYKRYLSDAQNVKIPILPNIPDIVPDVAAELAQIINAPMEWINKGLFRVAMFVGGGVLLLAGIALLAMQGQNAAAVKLAKPIAGAVGKVGKVGKAAK